MNRKLHSKSNRRSHPRCSLLLLALLGIAPLQGFARGRESLTISSVAYNARYNAKQDTPISGVVRDANGQPLPGVSVSLKGTSTGTITDVEGRFTLNVTGVTQPMLVFSYIGFQNQEVAVGNQDTFNISLTEDAELMDEVVVVGYGTQRKANLTGAVSQVSSEVLEDRPITNVTSGLQGAMPGVTITNASGAPGNNAGDIRIRGLGTWGDAQPLVVIDGIISTVSNLNILNPNDIATVSVLKDAASSSIYGVRGANGVIVVTTKKGVAGKPTIAYNGYFGIQTPTALPEFLGSPDFMQLLNESRVNVGLNPTYSPEEIEIARNGSDPNYYANTNWMEEIYKDYAPQQSHNLSVNGGSENVNYYLSYGYLNEGGLITGDNC